MTSVIAPNVFNIAVEANFDDCQDMVKEMFSHPEFMKGLKVSAVNSINWARIVAQIVYYFQAVLEINGGEAPVSFSVPSGNLGDVFAGYMAKKMGLPVNLLVVSTNENDILHRFFSSNDYSRHGVKQTVAPSMDIQVSSNFERLLFLEHNHNGAEINEKMVDFKKGGNLNVKPDIEEAITNGHQYQVKQNKDRRAHNTTPNYTIRHNFVENNEESHIPRDNRQKIQQKNTQIVQIEDYDVSYTRPDIIVPNQRHTVNNNCKFQQPPLKTTNDAVCIFIKQGENMYEITNSNMVAFLNDLKNKKFEETEFEGVYKRID
jgi:hypothetical protein